MEADRIKTLLDKYYSGDILPTEYQDLLSALNKDTELPSELEAERKVLHTIESYVPKIPEGFESRLEVAIDRQNIGKRRILKMIISGSVAAILLICIATGGYRINNKIVSADEDIAFINDNNYEDFAKDTQIADEALLSVLSSIQEAHTEVIESIESIQINQTEDFNIF